MIARVVILINAEVCKLLKILEVESEKYATLLPLAYHSLHLYTCRCCQPTLVNFVFLPNSKYFDKHSHSHHHWESLGLAFLLPQCTGLLSLFGFCNELDLFKICAILPLLEAEVFSQRLYLIKFPFVQWWDFYNHYPIVIPGRLNNLIFFFFLLFS